MPDPCTEAEPYSSNQHRNAQEDEPGMLPERRFNDDQDFLHLFRPVVVLDIHFHLQPVFSGREVIEDDASLRTGLLPGFITALQYPVRKLLTMGIF